MTGPLDLGEAEVKRVSLDIDASDNAFVERYAAYRNALATVQEKKLKQQWSAKSLAESFLSIECVAARHQLKEMFDAVGYFPPATGDKPTDDDAMIAYATKVVAWDKKHNK